MLLHCVSPICFVFCFIKISFGLGCLPNPDKNESVLKALALYAIKNHKQSLINNTESSILSIFKRAIADEIKAKEAYALAVGKYSFCFV